MPCLDDLMANLFVESMLVALSAALLVPQGAMAQAQDPTRPVEQRPQSLSQKLEKTGSGGPAPRRDLSGFWAGSLEPNLHQVPAMTEVGQARFKSNTPEPFNEHSNDPWRTCDPFGFPRVVTNQTRGLAFAQMPDHIVVMTQYEKIWRSVWMDGRTLPKNVGTKGGPDSRWYGYSVGHWDGDYTLVVETTGADDRTWMDRRGYPHSVEMRAEERYKRVDHNTLELTLTIDDPMIYTKPFVLATNRFRWIPNQEEEEQLCVPSEAIEYMKIIAGPADQERALGKK